MRVAAYDAESCRGNFRLNRRPDIAAEVLDRVNVWLPIHRADKKHQQIHRSGNRARTVLLQVDASRHNRDPRRVRPFTHQVSIVFRYRDYVMELPYRALFVAQHLFKFHLIHKSLRQISLGRGMSSPNFALYVVLKKNCGNCEVTWKISCRIEKITDGNIEVLFLEPSIQHFLNPNRLKSTDCIRNRRGHPNQIVQATPDRIESAFSRTEANGSRKLPREVCLILGIALSVVIGEKDEFVDPGQSTKNLVRTDIPAAV